MKKQWQKPVLTTLKAGSAENTQGGPNSDGGSPGSARKS